MHSNGSGPCEWPQREPWGSLGELKGPTSAPVLPPIRVLITCTQDFTLLSLEKEHLWEQSDDEDPDWEKLRNLSKVTQMITEEGNQGLTVCGINVDMLERERTKQRCLEVWTPRINWPPPHWFCWTSATSRVTRCQTKFWTVFDKKSTLPFQQQIPHSLWVQLGQVLFLGPWPPTHPPIHTQIIHSST